MSIWAIADLHLPFGAPGKSMEAFGPLWQDYVQKIEAGWKDVISSEDLVLIAGDISWAKRLDEALADLRWIDRLPGTKVMVKGNHDFWWDSKAKLLALNLSTIHFLQSEAYCWHEVAIGGTRLWDSEEYNFDSFIHFQENPKARNVRPVDKGENERIFAREIERLKRSLDQLNKSAKIRIAMTHYPPIGADLAPSRTSKVLEEHQVQYAVFGHLHNVDKTKRLFGEARGVSYRLTSCDYLDFKPLRVL